MKNCSQNGLTATRERESSSGIASSCNDIVLQPRARSLKHPSTVHLREADLVAYAADPVRWSLRSCNASIYCTLVARGVAMVD
jgi:hypothetical protein